MADAVTRLIRLRTAEADAARRDVATALRAHGKAEAGLAAAQSAIAAEARRAPADAADPLAGAYPRWLPAGQAALRRAAQEESVRRADLDAVRDALTSARVSLRACEALRAARAEAQRHHQTKQEQLAMEDCTRRK